MKDELFIKRLTSGDEEAFEQLVSGCEKQVYALARRYTNNPADAMDISQEVYIKVFRSLPKFKGDSAPETWVYRIAVNTALDFVRRTKRQNETSINTVNSDGEETELPLPDDSYSPHISAEQGDLREALSDAIASLPEEHRQVIILRDINDLSYERIGEILDLNEGTVKSRLFRARAKLREILMKNGNFPSVASSKDKKGGGKNA